MFLSPRKVLSVCAVILSAMIASHNVSAQTPISPTTWGGTTPNTAAGPSAYAPLPASTSPGTARVNVSQWERGPSVSYNAGANRYNSNGWTIGASVVTTVYAAGDYIYFTITNNATTELKITGVNIGTGQASGTGPNTFGLMYRIGSTSALVFGSNSSGPSPSFSMPAGVTVCAGQTITFYLCGWGGSSAAGTWSINNSAAITAQWANAITATASNTSPVIAGTPFTLTSSPSGGVTTYNYSWSGPLSYGSTSPSPSVTPASTSASGIYTLQVTDAWGCTATATTNVTVNPAVACSGTPTGGTTVAAPASHCGSGSSTLSLSGASTASGLTYEWLTSPTAGGPYTVIASATSPTYTTPTLTSTTYYRCVITCAAASTFDTSSEVAVTINPLPVISAPGGDVCSGGTGRTITASGASTYSWAPSTGLSATAGATVTANPTNNITYTVTGTDAAGCMNSTTVAVNYVTTPGALSVSPTTATACAGATPQLLTATGGLVGPTTVSSGSVTIPASIGAFGTITTNLSMAGIPAGATITGASVNLISFGSQYQDDYVINIKAPNGNILNLINQRGTHTSTVTTLFANTNVSSAGATSLASGSGSFTGTWMADAVNAVGGAPYTANTTSWSSLYSVPNGTWTLSIYNNTGFSNTVISTMQWSITLTYSYQPPITWSPFTNLYTDAAGTTPYTGSATTNVYFSPATAGTVAYVATASNSSCTRTATVNTTVNALPVVTGSDTVCIGQTVTLSGTPSGGTWTSSNANVSVAAADITGVTAGTSEVTYTLPSGCYATFTVTVNALPSAITGPLSVCESATILLNTASTGGTWSSSNTDAAVDAAGEVTGNTFGSSTISYTLPTGCYTTHDVTVNQTPSAISGPSSVCIGSSILLANSIAAGTWSADNANVTVDALGNVSGVSAGTSTISYVLSTGCYVTKSITINALPSAITGPSVVCEGGSTIDLDNTLPGGTWSRSNTNISIDASTGIVTGINAGNSIATYTAATGCFTVKALTINAVPAPITGTLNMCVSNTTMLSSTTGGGTWHSANSEVSVSTISGAVTGLSAGTALVTYTIPTGCYTFTVITVDLTPASITGAGAVCQNSAIALSNSVTGGTWTASNTNVIANTTTGNIDGISMGTADITYTLSTGCFATRNISVNPLPAAITGPATMCVGAPVAYATTSTGGTWTSSNIAAASINNTSGLLTGNAAGTTVVSYTFSATGCFSSTTVTVNAQPSEPTGLSFICTGATVPFSSTTAGGTWSSSNTLTASVDGSGNVSANASGTARISYTLPATGCASYSTVTVTATPSAITGSHQVCILHSVTLTNSTAGGTWSASNPAVGSINTTTGVFTGITPGTVTVTYGLLSGCSISTTITVTALPPAITGTSDICIGTSNMLFNTVTGGTWSTTTPSVISVSSVTGTITGIAAGSATVVYTTGTGCSVSKSVTVNPLPATITGAYTVCEGRTTTLSNAVSGGTWAIDNPAIGTIDASGILTGAGAGIVYVTYTLPTNCKAFAGITVNSTPAAITGSTNICIGASSSLSSSTPTGTWSSSHPSIAPISGTGSTFGNATGTSTISYTNVNGCYATTVATVHPLPTLQSVSGGGSYCLGGSGVSIGVGGSQAGVDYSLYSGPTFMASVAGTGSPVSFGLITTAGAYTVQAVNSTTGCIKNMTGIASVSIQPLVTPAVTTTTIAGTDTSCADAPVTFNANPVNGGTSPAYMWFTNGIFAASSPTYTYNPIDGDVVSVKMISTASCRAFDTAIALNTRVVLPGESPEVIVSVFPNDTVCLSTLVTFTATPVNGGTTPSFSWIRNGIPVATGDTLSYLPADNDVVKCIITSNYRCRTADTAHSATTKMEVMTPTLPIVTISAFPGLTISTGQTCTFSASATNAGTSPSYQWTVNGTNIPGATISTFSSNTLNNGDIVSCIVTSGGICSGISNYSSVVVTVLDPSGTSTLSHTSIQLHPNPNSGSFEITGLPQTWISEEISLTLTNMLGQKAYEQRMTPGENTIHINVDQALPGGVYIITFGTKQEKTSMRFLLKR